MNLPRYEHLKNYRSLDSLKRDIINNEGEWRNGGVYVSFKPKNQWSDR